MHTVALSTQVTEEERGRKQGANEGWVSGSSQGRLHLVYQASHSDKQGAWNSIYKRVLW